MQESVSAHLNISVEALPLAGGQQLAPDPSLEEPQGK